MKIKTIDECLEEMKNSKYKVGQVLYNVLSGYNGPIQRLAHSSGEVIYYHGNNPWPEDVFDTPGNRRSLF